MHTFFENLLTLNIFFNIFMHRSKLSTCDMYETYSLGPVSHLEFNIEEFY